MLNGKDMKFYGYQNSKVNRLIGATTGGNWKQVSFMRFCGLVICGYITKTED